MLLYDGSLLRCQKYMILNQQLKLSINYFYDKKFKHIQRQRGECNELPYTHDPVLSMIKICCICLACFSFVGNKKQNM